MNYFLDKVRFWAVYPRTKSIEVTRPPLLTSTYTCYEDKCDFTNVIKDIQNSSAVKIHDPKNTCEKVFNVMTTDQQYHLAYKMDGISVQIGSEEVIRAYRCTKLNKDSDKCSNEKSGRFCFINAK